MARDEAIRLGLAWKALKGTALGDAFGESFFGETEMILQHIATRRIPPTSWEFTDDTVMALAVFEELEADGYVYANRLAAKFARNYALDNRRGYGGTAHKVLREIGEGGDWQKISAEVFDGMGSMGNGAAMRVAPLGAYFHDQIDNPDFAAQVRASAIPTHANEEAIAGAFAVATAAAFAAEIGLGRKTTSPEDFIRQVAWHIPESDTRYKVAKAATFPPDTHPETLKAVLGNGSRMLAQDTVPFAIWCAAHHLHDFEAALWKAVSVLGDRDTIAAIVGGIVILSCDDATVPPAWQNALEKPDTSIFRTRSPK